MSHKISITGNLGKDPEGRFLPDGTQVTSFSVASNEYGNKTLWFRVSAFGKLAEVCDKYLAKGRKVQVWGTLTGDPETGGPRIWTDNSGNARASFELRAESVEFLSGAGEADAGDEPF